MFQNIFVQSSGHMAQVGTLLDLRLDMLHVQQILGCMEYHPQHLFIHPKAFDSQISLGTKIPTSPAATLNIKRLTPAVAASFPYYPGWTSQNVARPNHHPAFANHAHYSAVEESPSSVAGLQGESRALPNGCPTRNNAEEKDLYFKTKVGGVKKSW